MNNKIIISIFILSLFWGFFYYNNLEKTNTSQKNIYIKNNSWNTDFLKEVSSKKNDQVELLLILDEKKASFWKIDYSKIEQNLDIEKIFIDEKEVNKNDEVNINKDSSIKIIWKSKENNTLKSSDLDINISDIFTKTNQEELKKDQELQIKKDIKLVINSKNIEVYKDNLIWLSWENLDFIDSIKIWEKYFKTIKIWEKYFLPIEKNVLKWWKYEIKILNKQNLETIFSNEINFIDNDNLIKIYDITPKIISKEKSTNIVLQWSWFSKIISIQINNNTILEKSNFEIISDNLAIVKLPKDLEIWDYYLNIMWTDKIYEIKNIFFTIN